MYKIGRKDRVENLADVPQSSVGAPLPVVVSNDYKAILAYLREPVGDWDGTTVQMVGPESVEPAAIIEFKLCYVYTFGSPNDEVFDSHPLYKRGLSPYGAYEIKNSSWIRQLERMNSVHPRHDPERFWRRHHYIFAFHDSTFECVADGLRIIETSGSMKTLLPRMCEMLTEGSSGEPTREYHIGSL